MMFYAAMALSILEGAIRLRIYHISGEATSTTFKLLSNEFGGFWVMVVMKLVTISIIWGIDSGTPITDILMTAVLFYYGISIALNIYLLWRLDYDSR